MSYYENTFKKTGAATTRRTAKRDPYKLLIDLREQDATSSWSRLFPKWKRTIESDDDYLDAALRYVWSNYTTTYDKDATREKRRKQTYRTVAEERESVSEFVKATTRKAQSIALMNLEMPNGKRLRDCTFAEVGKFGSWFKMLATKGKPSEIVGEKLSEDDLRKLK